MRPTVIFDLDGTLVDSRLDICDALNRLMASRLQPSFTLAEVTSFIGDGVPVLLQRAFSARQLEQDPAALSDFLTEYEAKAAERTRPFPGIIPVLDELRARDWQMMVCTNKPERAARLLLEALGLCPYFSALGGGDSFPIRKPDPRHLLLTLAKTGTSANHAVMVGDHHNDVAAGLAAGCQTIFCRWGYGEPSDAPGVRIAGAPAELPKLLEDALAGMVPVSSK
ncbi:phosphoglycolate phosphatase [Pseudoroseomonas globiformis]|uniref:phosphoglycolate phosphatase n=1 Tax=Teichococcus globiformis TaxID=2307229 RepID=A0ABV7G2E6_9PROT